MASTKSSRGLWLTARTKGGWLRPAWTLETEVLEEELARRKHASEVYYNPRFAHKYGASSIVSRRNEEAIALILYILEHRDGLAPIPF